MRSGVRLTQLAIGEPLLLTNWSYKNLNGIPAVEQRLCDLFFMAKSTGFNCIIDTIKPKVINNELSLEKNGVCGDIWTLERRLDLYRQYSSLNKIDITFEIDFPYIISDTNWQQYADFVLILIKKYNWVKYWQIGTNPDEYDKIYQTKYRCSPALYYKILNYIYPKVKTYSSNTYILGPGVYASLVKYVNNDKMNWFSIAIGDEHNNPEYEQLGKKGILDYIDFLTIQARQENDIISYSKLSMAIDKLNTMFINKMCPQKEILSIYQGRSIDNNESTELTFFDVREFLNCIKNNVVPFKHQLVDEIQEAVDGGFIPGEKLNYGLLKYHLGMNGYKQIYTIYKFLLSFLKDFNKITRQNDVVQDNNQIETLTFKSNDNQRLATIIWPKHTNNVEVILKPHFSRTYVSIDQQSLQSVVKPILYRFNEYNQFIIVFEQLSSDKINMKKIEEYIDKKLNKSEESLANFIKVLPNSYNKETKDLNYYKLLRSLSLELADAQIQVEEVKNNMYIDSVTGDAIYNNFGILVNLSKKNTWTEDQYKGLVKGVTQSHLKGPTPKSIIDAIRLFTNFEIDVNLYELYKGERLIDDPVFDGVNSKFAFVVEVEKPIGSSVDRDTLYEEISYVINIVKPAHTLSIILITLVGKENYKDYYKDRYKENFESSDKFLTQYESSYHETQYGWKIGNNNPILSTQNVEQSYMTSLTNGGLFIGPRYVLYDEDLTYFSINMSEKDIVNIEEDVDSYLSIYSSEKYNKYKELFTSTASINNEDKFISSYFRKIKNNQIYTNNVLQNSPFLNSLKMNYQPEQAFEQLEYLFKTPQYNEIVTKKPEESILFGPQIYFEKYNKVIENENKIDAQHDFIENYRTFEITSESYHQHKKVSSIITGSNIFAIYTHNGDLFSSSIGNKSSNAKVYLNGLLLPYWAYEEIPSDLVKDRSIGVVIESEYIRPGDHITLVYFKEQSANEGKFPINEQITFEGTEYKDNVNWIQWKKPMPKNKFKLNLCKLNSSFILYGIPKQEMFEMEMYKDDYCVRTLIKKKSF